MAIQYIVEDGTGMSTATSYISLVDAKQYWENLGYDYSALSDDQLSVLFNKAAKAVDGQYRLRFPGYRKLDTQTLEWPRYDAYYYDGWDILSSEIPEELGWAVAEMGYASNQGTDIRPVQAPEGMAISVAVKASPVSEAKTYLYGSPSGRSRINAVEDLLKRILLPGNGLVLRRI